MGRASRRIGNVNGGDPSWKCASLSPASRYNRRMLIASNYRAGSAPAKAPARRRVLRAAVAVLASPMLVLASRSRANESSVRTVSFYHTHTAEALSITYALGDSYLPRALVQVNRFLRDFRTGEVGAIDPQLLDQLHTLAAITGSRAPYQVISGYRSLATNQALRERGGGVATHSLHLEGRAIDVRLADVALADLRDASISMGAGGVGYYPQSQFVHLDTGRVRRW